MTQTSGQIIVRAAARILQVFMAAEQVPSAEAQEGLEFLNRMIGSWANQSLTIPAVARVVAPLVAGKGGPSNPYTIGVGGDVNTVRPSSQKNITGVGCLLAPVASSPAVEIPRALYTDDGYNGIFVKELTNALFTGLWYNPTYTTGFGTVNLWPVPNNTLNSLVLYVQQPLAQFADLFTLYYVGDGVEQALIDNLVTKLAKPWGATLDADMRLDASLSLMTVKRANVKMTDMPNDLVMRNARGGYDINTGQGGGQP